MLSLGASLVAARADLPHALGEMAVAERVRKVFAIQEERKKQYGRLEK